MLKHITRIASVLAIGAMFWSCTKDLEEKVDSLTDQVNALQTGKVATLETQLAAVQATAKTLASQANLDAVNEKVASLEASAKTLEANLATANSDITALQTADKALQASLTAANSDIAALQAADKSIQASLTSSLADVMKAIEAVNTAVTAAQKDIDALESKESALESKESDDVKALSAALAACAKASDVNALSSMLSDKISDVQTSFASEVSTLSSKLSDVQAAFADYQAQVAADFATVNAQIAENKEAIANNAKAIEELNALAEQIQATIKSNKDDLDAYKAATDAAIEPINEVLGILSGSDEETLAALKALGSKLGDYVLMSEFESTVSGLATKKELAEHIAAFTAQKEVYEKFVADYNEQIEAIDATDDAQDAKISQLESHMAEAEKAIENIEGTIDEMKEVDAAMQKSIDALQVSLKDAVQSITDLKNLVLGDEVKGNIAANQASIAQLKSDIEAKIAKLTEDVFAVLTFLSEKIDGITVLYSQAYTERAYGVVIPVKVNPSDAKVDTNAFSLAWDPSYAATKSMLDPSRYLKIKKVYTPDELAAYKFSLKSNYYSGRLYKATKDTMDYSGVYGIAIEWQKDFRSKDMPIFIEYSYKDTTVNKVSTVTSSTPVIVSEIYRTLYKEDVPVQDSIVLWKNEKDTINLAMYNNYYYTYLSSIEFEDLNNAGAVSFTPEARTANDRTISDTNEFVLSNIYGTPEDGINYKEANVQYVVTDKGQDAIHYAADPYTRIPEYTLPAIYPNPVTNTFKTLSYCGNDNVSYEEADEFIPEADKDMTVDVKGWFASKLNISEKLGWTVKPTGTYTVACGSQVLDAKKLTKTFSDFKATNDKITYKILTTAKVTDPASPDTTNYDVTDKVIDFKFEYLAQNKFRACTDSVKLTITVPVKVMKPKFYFNMNSKEGMKPYIYAVPSHQGSNFAQGYYLYSKNYGTRKISEVLNETQQKGLSDMPTYVKDTCYLEVSYKDSVIATVPFGKNAKEIGMLPAVDSSYWAIKADTYASDNVRYRVVPVVKLVGGQILRGDSKGESDSYAYLKSANFGQSSAYSFTIDHLKWYIKSANIVSLSGDDYLSMNNAIYGSKGNGDKPLPEKRITTNNLIYYTFAKGKVNPDAKLGGRYEIIGANSYSDMNDSDCIADTTSYKVTYSCESVVLNETGTVEQKYYNLKLLKIDEKTGVISLNTEVPGAQTLIDDAPYKFYQVFRVTAVDLWGNVLTRDFKVYLKADPANGNTTESPNKESGEGFFTPQDN